MECRYVLKLKSFNNSWRRHAIPNVVKICLLEPEIQFADRSVLPSECSVLSLRAKNVQILVPEFDCNELAQEKVLSFAAFLIQLYAFVKKLRVPRF